MNLPVSLHNLKSAARFREIDPMIALDRRASRVKHVRDRTRARIDRFGAPDDESHPRSCMALLDLRASRLRGVLGSLGSVVFVAGAVPGAAGGEPWGVR